MNFRGGFDSGVGYLTGDVVIFKLAAYVAADETKDEPPGGAGRCSSTHPRGRRDSPDRKETAGPRATKATLVDRTARASWAERSTGPAAGCWL